MLRDLSRSACRRRTRDAVDRTGCADIAARKPNAPAVGSGVPQPASAARISFIATCEGCSSQAIAHSLSLLFGHFIVRKSLRPRTEKGLLFTLCKSKS